VCCTRGILNPANEHCAFFSCNSGKDFHCNAPRKLVADDVVCLQLDLVLGTMVITVVGSDELAPNHTFSHYFGKGHNVSDPMNANLDAFGPRGDPADFFIGATVGKYFSVLVALLLLSVVDLTTVYNDNTQA
jgi:hypothetical protein